MIKQRSVWGYFAVGLICLVLGLIALAQPGSASIPPRSNLEKITGEVATVNIIDELSGESTALLSPLNTIHFTLSDGQTVFRYPGRWPGYSDLYTRLAFEVDVWVDPDELSGDEPVTIYKLEQRTPKGWLTPPISVDYQAIANAQDVGEDSYRRLALALLAAAPVSFAVGVMVLRSNRRNRKVPKAD